MRRVIPWLRQRATITLPQWFSCGSLVLVVVALFLPWSYLTADDPAVAEALRELPEDDVVRNVWSSGFFAWSAPILLLVAAMAVVSLGRSAKARAYGLPHLGLTAVLVALVLLVFGWFSIGWQFGAEQRALLVDSGVELHSGIGRYLGSLAVGFSLVGALLEIRLMRKKQRRSVRH